MGLVEQAMLEARRHERANLVARLAEIDRETAAIDKGQAIARSVFDAMDHTKRAEYLRNGGTLFDDPKPKPNA